MFNTTIATFYYQLWVWCKHATPVVLVKWVGFPTFNYRVPQGCNHYVCIMCGDFAIFPFRISIWNGPTCMLSFNSTTSSTLSVCPGLPMLLLMDDSSVTICHDNSCVKWTVAQGVEIQSNSLSLMMFIMCPSMQVPLPMTLFWTLLWKMLIHLGQLGTPHPVIPCHLLHLEPHNYES